LRHEVFDFEEEGMSRPPEQKNTLSPRWWVRLCQWLWSQRGFIWGTLIAGIFVSVAATWLTTPTSIFAGTPLGTVLPWIREHLLLAGLIGVILFLLTLLVGAVSQRADIPTRAGATADQQQQNRRAFIHRLRYEYRRQMDESLQGAAMMTLALQQRTDVVLSSVSLVSWHMDASSDRSSPTPTSIVQAYDDAGGGLLLLGAPGAGKSTLLRELASELLTRVEEDSTQPIPMILNLSSWAIKKPPLITWLVDQLQLVYAIPHRVSQMLIEQELLLLLLDGLDEMKSSAQSDCIEAINAYRDRAEHFVPIVVCSRSHEYIRQEGRLRVPVVVEVRPLTPAQVESYLKQVGKSLAAVRAALRSNGVLRDLVTTPLMLSVVMLAYHGKTVKDLPQLGSAEDQQRQVFAHYVTRMLEQPTRKWRYTPDSTQKWVIWLAQQMKQRQFTEFYLERLQPTWLSTKRTQIAHNMLVGLAGGLVSALVVGLAGVLYYRPAVRSYGLVGGLSYGLVFGLVSSLMRRSEIQPSEKLTWSWTSFLQGLAGGLFGGSIGWLVDWLVFGPLSVQFGALGSSLIGLLLGGLASGLLGGLAGELVGALMMRSRTQPSEKLMWSWNSFLRGLTGGLVGLLVFELTEGSLVLVGLLTSWLFGGLTGGLVTGLSDTQVDEYSRLRPNQGIQASGWNALRSGLVSGLGIGLAGVLLGGLTGGLFFGLAAGLFVGLVRGGLAYLQHYCLRFLLWRSGAMPWRYVRFLEEATERILLQRVGGGYRFIHPLFLDYFASLGTPALSSSVRSPSR